MQVHHNELLFWKQFPPTSAVHGANCSAPPATHTVTSHEQAVFICNNHVMTTIEAGYGLIYLTPNQMVDFAGGEAVVRFDMSTLRTSSRDWVDLWVTPYEDNLALPLDDGVDLNGPPRRAVHVRMGWNRQSIFTGEVYREFVPTYLTIQRHDGIEAILIPSAVDREPFELRIRNAGPIRAAESRSVVARQRGRGPGLDARGGAARSPHVRSGQGVRPAQPVSGQYDEGLHGPCPNTWHWDNVRIEPAVPFTILRADRRYVDATSPPSVTLPAPAPPGAHLRFGGVGRALDVSFDGGATWQPAQLQAQQETNGTNAFQSFWTPIPPERRRSISGARTAHCPGWCGTSRCLLPRSRGPEHATAR